MFRVISQTMLNYHDSPLSEGSAGKVKGGDRLPWLGRGGPDNHAPLAAIAWQVHVYGSPSPELRAWCEQGDVPLHVFDWQPVCDEAGFARDAAYLIRPDGYVALAESRGRAEAMARYFEAMLTGRRP
jgi:hypothetical protein